MSLLYVSRSTIDAGEAQATIAEIVETAQRVNPPRGLTGALIFTGASFAQILEGPTDAVETMIAAIASDPRHKDVFIADRSPTLERRFAQWSMAYFGRVNFVERHITKVFEERTGIELPLAARRLRQLMREFSL
ncbi:BLUF domain-containing protein [Sphingomonas sp. PAMC 26621]|uniref:BLUF domain-containing protein n=1 Tax=Sphingomonas sp. PAMC 26621 TaxID=1112213 RepID=UPI0002899AB9|nr:BLUF domain-containing protein [Sphingomonas sp. PAMC 26621]